MRNRSGITLIALITAITMIVILTGVTLKLAINEDGVIGKTGKSAKKYDADQAYEELYSKILQIQSNDIRTEPTLKSVLNVLVGEDGYIIRTEREKDDPEGTSIIDDIDELNSLDDNIGSIYIVYKGHEFELGSNLKLQKIHDNKQLANADENNSNNNSSNNVAGTNTTNSTNTTSYTNTNNTSNTSNNNNNTSNSSNTSNNNNNTSNSSNTSNNNTNTTNTVSGGNSQSEQTQSQYVSLGEIYTTSTSISSARVLINVNSPFSANVPANQSSQSNTSGENILYTTVSGSGNARNFDYFTLYYAGYGSGGWTITAIGDNIYYSDELIGSTTKTKFNQINWEFNISKDYYIYTLDNGNYTLRKEIRTSSTGGNNAALNVADLQSNSEQEVTEIPDYSVEINHVTAGTAQNYYYFSVSYSSYNWRVSPLNNYSNIYFTTTTTPQESDYTQLTSSNLYWQYTATNHYYLFIKNE